MSTDAFPPMTVAQLADRLKNMDPAALVHLRVETERGPIGTGVARVEDALLRHAYVSSRHGMESWVDLEGTIEAVRPFQKRTLNIERVPAREREFVDDLVALVAKADALYAAAHAHFQAKSDAEHMAEFGIKGPSLAGFLPGGPDREYVYSRHKLNRDWPEKGLPTAMIALGQRSAEAGT